MICCVFYFCGMLFGGIIDYGQTEKAGPAIPIGIVGLVVWGTLFVGKTYL